VPFVLGSRVIAVQANGLPGDAGEARFVSRSYDERLSLSESAQLPGRDPGVDGLVRVPGAHNARRKCA